MLRKLRLRQKNGFLIKRRVLCYQHENVIFGNLLLRNQQISITLTTIDRRKKIFVVPFFSPR